MRKSLCLLALLPLPAFAQDIALPKPDLAGGKPLMQALAERKSSREFSAREIDTPVLSGLLWAAFGVNRPDGRRTAPSAMNWQETDVYVATKDGLFLYDAPAHALKPVLKQDVRTLCGQQPFVATAPVNLVYVSDWRRIKRGTDADKSLYSGADVGFIAENVYLYCASEGLACVVRGSIPREELGQAMKLAPEQRIILSQTVGWPAE